MTMSTFTIDSENAITRYDSAAEVPEGAASFATEEELNALAEHWPGARLIEIWNGIPGVQPVRKFTSRKVAVRRIWTALEPRRSEPAIVVKRKRAPAKRTETATKGSGASKPGPMKPGGTKTDRVIALLRRPEGATLKQLMSATEWQPHSVRGFISAQIGKRLGLRVKSFTRAGERVYRIKK